MTTTEAGPVDPPRTAGLDGPTPPGSRWPGVGALAAAALAGALVGAAVMGVATRTDGAAESATTRPPGVDPIPDPEPAALPGWELTFADEFDGDAVDPSLWYVSDEARGDSVESPKTTTCPLASNVSVTDRRLVMRTRPAGGDCVGGQPVAGAALSTAGTFTQAQGRFEARARWTHAGNYLWGGFWTHGNIDASWRREDPTEIDVFEYIGKDAEPNISRFKPAIHFDYTCEGLCGMQNISHQPYDVTQWHTYAVEWEPTDPDDAVTTEIRFLLDDRLIATFDRQGAWEVGTDGERTQVVDGGWGNRVAPFPNPFGADRPHQLILSAWVGAPGVDPATASAGFDPDGGEAALEVDHVRVYARP